MPIASAYGIFFFFVGTIPAPGIPHFLPNSILGIVVSACTLRERGDHEKEEGGSNILVFYKSSLPSFLAGLFLSFSKRAECTGE